MLTDDICRVTIHSSDDISTGDINQDHSKGVFNEVIQMKKSEPMSESYYYILLCLAKGANHGYGIMQMTESLSGGDVKIGSGTMYGATSNMMKKGWICEIMSDEPGVERRRLYKLTEEGREALRTEIARLSRMLENAQEV